MNIIVKRVKLFFKEVLNFLTDLVIPLLDLVIVLLALLPVPTKWIVILKTVEKILKEAGGKLEEAIEIMKERV